jgi:hypothetical protein
MGTNKKVKIVFLVAISVEKTLGDSHYNRAVEFIKCVIGKKGEQIADIYRHAHFTTKIARERNP